MTYNGWTNRATWNVNLWLDNDHDLYLSKGAFIEHHLPNRLTPEAVRDWVTNVVFPNGTPDVRDLSTVDWTELARDWTIEGQERRLHTHGWTRLG